MEWNSHNNYRSSDSLISRFARSPSANRSRPPSHQGEGQLLRLHRSGSNGRSSSNGGPSSAGRASTTDKSMLPGHSHSILSSKLEASRQAFRASQTSMARPLSAGPRPRSSSVSRPGSGSQLRGSDPSPLLPRREGERPRAYTCYLCGQQYGSASLMIHIPQCQKKWIAVEEQKPRRERRPLPPPPSSIAGGQLPTGKGADDFNEEMYQHWDQKSLVGCPFCARTFRPEAFEKHKKVCTAANPGGPLGPGRNQVPRAGGVAGPANPGRPASPASRGPGGARPPSGGPPAAAPTAANMSRPGPAAAGTRGSGGGGGMASKPLGFTCYLCGQQYGSASLIIHIGQCQKKWVTVNSTKPRREQRPLPPPPPLLHDLEALPTSPQGIEDFNREMFAYWDKVSLMACSTCGRTFRPDAFERHLKVCAPKPGSPAAGGSGGGRGAGGGPNYDARPRAYNCYLCGQQYGSQSLLIHIPQCFEKWLKVEAAKPPKERREPPPPPPELDEPLPTHPDEIDAFNARMCGAFNDKSLMRCKHCGRSMRPDALSKHQRLCTAESPMKGGGGGSPSAGGGGGGGGSSSSSPAAVAGAGVPGMTMGSSSGNGGPAEYADEGGEDLEECEHCNRRMRYACVTII
ncbi:hypothetical protein DUNSADRAFT_12647 [Dunaliella salina]|uniref:C2HC/C3H-type domain-containing protein n=1 Tax=Dunaliella salina TaxID=3046 RepID=A0ABQ7H3P3_DUNSA|nr:hypothetical protein DUNSADRAFT_12647 [Dunaliella salina]|eukprot:KAF5841482.1 hypothetical protein DUNSADRAFT_12647 [Dunaliella salina]